MTISNVFIQKDSSCSFNGTVDSDSITIDLEVKKERDVWTIEGKASFIQKDTPLEYLIKKTSIASGDVKFLGSWMPVFEKENIHINFHPTISYEKLGHLSNETLLAVSGYTNGVFLRSDYLNQIK